MKFARDVRRQLEGVLGGIASKQERRQGGGKGRGRRRRGQRRERGSGGAQGDAADEGPRRIPCRGGRAQGRLQRLRNPPRKEDAGDLPPSLLLLPPPPPPPYSPGNLPSSRDVMVP